MKRIFSFYAVFLLIISTNLTAQTNVQQLTQIILHRDSLFWQGYNTCDTALTGQFFTEDLEFYHDKGGITNGLPALQASLKNNLCSKPDWRLRREAVPGTVKVFPLQNNDTIYGAILLGEHYFYITEKGKPEYRSGQASFTHLWLKKNGVWKMTRILSYDHHAAAYVNERKAIVVPAATLKEYAGRYKGPQTESLIIQLEKTNLVMVAGNDKLLLLPETVNTFFVKERELTFEFILDDKKKVTGVRVREKGAVVEELKVVK